MAVMDVPGAFLQADMPEDESVHVWIYGSMADTFLEIDPDLYGPYVVMEGKEKVLYLELLKALYGTLRRNYPESSYVEDWGFVGKSV